MALATTRIQLCGRYALDDCGTRVDGRLPGRQGRLLLAYLVVNWDRTVTRDELAFALWGDELPHDLETCLSAVLSKVRRVVGPARLQGRGELRFLPDEETFVDVHYAIEALHRAEAHAAAGRFGDAWQPSHTSYHIARRRFLLGHEAEWIDEWRHRLDAVATRALECHVRCNLAEGYRDAPNAERVARLLVERAPFRESGYALIMEAIALQGNPAEGLRVYEALNRLLRDEMGVPPGAEVNRLRDRLLGIPQV